jgi:uncharacterized phage-like protein YoqJ
VIVAVTGHRPPKIGGWNPENPLRRWVRAQIEEVLLDLKPERAITGMALGVDQEFADVCIDLNIPYVAAVPFEGQEQVWPDKAQRLYHQLLGQADEIVYVSSPGYAGWKMKARNRWMVDHCNRLLAVFDGTLGGTASTVLYAEQIGRSISRINPKDFH